MTSEFSKIYMCEYLFKKQINLQGNISSATKLVGFE